MDKALILLAGLPGTGKTYLSNIINSKLGSFYNLSQDDLKEYYCDIYGYRNLEEKQKIEKIAWAKYYEIMEKQMQVGDNIMSDYPFSQKQKPHIQQLVDRYGYEIVTIRLIADLDILFERQKKRDLDPTRHLSHIVTSYKKGDHLANRSNADNLLIYEEFINRCTTRGYDTFELGKLYEVDVSDYTKVNYSRLLEDIERGIH
ncbi:MULTISPECIES: AAA family ATPase [unclassified Bacillus (in: firmicutes)]|uniref:AAA family ATPase n=1 Tax=Bacillaceae TaxID=186817 RepID=UPI000BF8F591|nr:MULTISPECIES: AAA family ATPase [unclassified Bacillus (in: firmicutes)]PEZ72679.1 kinase [Bacillus sp. AFS017274]